MIPTTIAVCFIAAVAPAEPAGVRELLTTQAEAWNKGNLEKFVDTYWDNDELTFYSGGTITKARKPLLERYKKNYQGEGKEMGKLTFTDLVIDSLSPDTCLARGRWKVVTSKESLDGLFTLVVKKFPEGWKIVHDHTSKTDPPKKP